MIRDQLRLTGYRLGSGPVTRGHRGSIYTPRVQYIEIFQKAIDKEIGQIVSDMTNRPMAVQNTAEQKSFTSLGANGRFQSLQVVVESTDCMV